MSLTYPAQQDVEVVYPTGPSVSGGATPPAWYWPAVAVLEGATFTDPSDQVEEPVTYASPGRMNIVTQNENVATYAPFAGPTWVFPIKGLDAADVSVIAGDILRAYVRAGGAYTDLVFWAGFRNSSNNHGFAGGIAWVSASSAYETVRSVNTGAGWSAPADGVGVSALTVAAVACADPGASGGTTMSGTTVALDASDAPIALTNQAVTRGAVNLTGPFDQFFVGFGFRTGSGAAAGGTIQLGCAFAVFPTVGANPFV